MRVCGSRLAVSLEKGTGLSEIDERYGIDFSQKLIDLYMDQKDAPNCWAEPITSKVGAHLICFKQVKLGAIPSIASIRSLLINDWRYAMTQQ